MLQPDRPIMRRAEGRWHDLAGLGRLSGYGRAKYKRARPAFRRVSASLSESQSAYCLQPSHSTALLAFCVAVVSFFSHWAAAIKLFNSLITPRP